MYNCCVPFCKSGGRKDKTGLFEFPSNIKQRLLWQNVIIQACADKGLSKDSCKFLDRSVVCEKHFTDNDISRSTKRRRILPNAVPSVFQNFSYVKQTNSSYTKEPSSRILSSFTKNYCPIEKKNIALNSSKQKEASLGKTSIQNIKYHNGEIKKETNCVKNPIIIKLNTDVSLNSSEQKNLFESNSSSENLEFHEGEVKKEQGCNDKDNEGEVKKEPRCNDEDKTLAKQLHNKLKILKRENANLRCRMKKSMKRYTLLTSNEKKLSLEEEQFKKIITEKAENKLPAILLFEQIKNFGKKKIILSNTALKFYFLWQKQFPAGYEFVRKLNFFSLPHRNTLTKYVDFSPEEVEEDASPMHVTISDEIEEIENIIIS